jgi:hypothetical protein
MIVAIHKAALTTAYGSAAWALIEAALQRYLAKVTATTPVSVLYLDDPAASGLTGEAAAAAGDSESAARLIRVQAQRMSPRPAAVLIIGGDEIVPMIRLPKPATLVEDQDQEIPTDNPFGCLTGDASRYVFPDMAVGRIVASVATGADDIAAQLDRAVQLRSTAAMSTGAFVVSNREWVDASMAVAAEISALPQVFQSAPLYRMSGGADDLNRSILFFNLHGVLTDPGWYAGTSSTPWRVMSPDDLAGANVSGATAMACNCYGALTRGVAPARSVALTLLRRGCAHFIGSTGYAFGALPPQTLDFSEELARRFFGQLAAGFPAGLALHRARREYVQARVAQGALDNRDYKTALQFVFWGDPLS